MYWYGASNQNLDLAHFFFSTFWSWSFVCLQISVTISATGMGHHGVRHIDKIPYCWRGRKMSSWRGLLCKGGWGGSKTRSLGGCCAVAFVHLCPSVLSAHKLDYFIRVQASIASATAVLFTLCPPLYIYLSISFYISHSSPLFGSLLPTPGPQTAWLNTQANVSLFKETQVVDMLAMGQDPNEELL